MCSEAEPDTAPLGFLSAPPAPPAAGLFFAFKWSGWGDKTVNKSNRVIVRKSEAEIVRSPQHGSAYLSTLADRYGIIV